MVGASGDGIFIECQCGDTAGGDYHGLVAASAFSNPCSPKAIQAPGPDIFLVLLDDKGICHAAADESALFVQTEGSWELGEGIRSACARERDGRADFARRIPR